MTGRPEPSRITAALDLRGLYGPEVDQACGVEEPTVDQWETGELVPTPTQIKRLAILTGFPVGYFYREPVRHICKCDIFVCRIHEGIPLSHYRT
jgi:transcriptional regulator with XRE-family HTH domain